MKKAKQQIIRQIEGRVEITVHYADSKPDTISLYEQDGKYWIKPAFCNDKEIPKTLFDELVSQFTDEQEFNTDNEVVRSKLKYDRFYDRYYNRIISPSYLRTAETELELNIKEMAEVLQTPYRTYQDWRDGKRRIPGVVGTAVFMLLKYNDKNYGRL